ncbi:MAG: hypothetical protein LBM02_09585 [Lachnospiraceae bacterium]|jgi:hypothetical protein|nr:hypothetical protein [Lachnospiraceae bacterium]
MGNIKKAIAILISFVFVVTLLEGCNVKKKIFDKGEKVINKMEEKQMKDKDEFTTSEKANKYLENALEKKFVGKKFQVISDPNYSYQKEDNYYSVETLVKDQNGIVANAGITARGQSSLWTDYMSSYYTLIVAKPIEKILNQFDFVENYNIALDQWDEHDDWNNLNWTAKEFFDNTGREYRLGVILKPDKSKTEYLNEIVSIYNALYDQQVNAFDVNYYVSDNIYYGISKYQYNDADENYYYGYYISTSIHNHVGDFGKDSKEMIEEDLKSSKYKESDNEEGFDIYGSVWKYLPKKVEEVQ